MLTHSRSLLGALASVASVAFIVAACGNDGSEFGDPPDPNGGIESGTFNTEGGGADGGDPFANDPPPKYCVLAGQPTPPTPGGTADCPDDKNKPGCGCLVAGEMAPCWTGLRVNRNLGVCKDGVATCNQINENEKRWSECVGQVLPTAGQTRGAPACKCFSVGQWKLANLSPCFIAYGSPCTGGPTACTYAVSTVTDGTGANMKPVGQSDCPVVPQNSAPPPTKPPSDWTTDTLKVDCAGHFKLCYELKAGSYDAPKAGDCSLTKLCVEADYLKENVEQAFPPLPAWTSSNTACAAQWEATGGYGEMTVVGESVLCDKVDDGAGNAFVFNRVRYCPALCRNMANAGLPECQNCQQGGSGEFK